MKNVMLSSQRVYAPARTLQEEVYARGGMIIPAHIFTPHRSIYGKLCAAHGRRARHGADQRRRAWA